MKKILFIMFCLLLLFSIVSVKSYENFYVYSGNVLNDEIKKSNLTINVYSKRFVSNQNVKQEELFLINTIYVNNNGSFAFYYESNEELVFELDSSKLPTDYIIDNNYIESFASNELDFIVSIKEDSFPVKSIEYNEDLPLSNCCNYENDFLIEKNNPSRNIDFSSNNPSLDYLFERLYFSNVYYNRYVICHDGLNNTILQQIADAIYDVDDYFVNTIGFFQPQTYNGLFYISVCSIGTDLGYTETVLDENDFPTSNTYMVLSNSIFQSSSDDPFNLTIAHEFFHSINRLYMLSFQNSLLTNKAWLNESFAVYASFEYCLQSTILSEDEIHKTNNFLSRYSDKFFLDKFFNDIPKHSLNDSGYRYAAFLFHFFISQQYGGINTIKTFVQRFSLIQSSIDSFDYYVSVLNYLGYNLSDFNELYSNFTVFLLDLSENANINSNFINSIKNTVSETIYSNKDFGETSTTIEPLSFAQIRFDSHYKSLARSKIIINVYMQDLLSASNDLTVLITTYYGTNKYTSYYNVSSQTSSNLFNIYIGNNECDHFTITIINTGSFDYNISLQNIVLYQPVDDSFYKIKCSNGSMEKFFSLELDEFNCINIYSNIFLMSNVYDDSQYFKFVLYNNSYRIFPIVTSYDPINYPNLRIGSFSNNVKITYDYMNHDYQDWIFVTIITGTYKICPLNSQLCIRAVDFNNGSNYNNLITSPGNIILSSQYSGSYLEKWSLKPMY